MRIKRDIAHRKDGQRLVDVPFKSVRLVVRMRSAAKLSFLEPRLVLEHRPGLHPFQTIDRLTVVVDQKVLSQSQQSVHHLPRSVISAGQESLSLHFASFVDQFDQRICGLLHGSGSCTYRNLVRALRKYNLRLVDGRVQLVRELFLTVADTGCEQADGRKQPQDSPEVSGMTQ